MTTGHDDGRQGRAGPPQEPEGIAPPVAVAFIGGHGRSGSTLLSRVVGSLPSVCGVGELRYVWDQGVLRDRGCGCGVPFSACPFWTRVGQEAFGGWEHVDAERAVRLRRSVERLRYLPLLTAPGLSASFRAHLEEYTALMSRLFPAIAAVSGCQVVVDTSKYPSTAYLLRRVPGVDLTLVHLVRSSHGVCYSWSKQVARPDRDGKPLAQYPYWRSARDWSIDNAAVEALAAQGVPRLLVRYEDFVEAPRPEVRRLLQALGVPVQDADLDFIGDREVTLGPDHSVAGNPNRFRTGTQALRLDDEWKRAMTPTSRRLISVSTAPGLLRYGYLARQGDATSGEHA